MTSITLPNGILTIGEGAFERCGDLMNINLPDGLHTISDDAFRFCDSLTSLTLPASVSTIGEEAFYSCGGLLSVNIPTGVTSIGEYTFYDCEELAILTLPDGIVTIGEGAFSGCYSLPSINIPASVTSIGIDVFYDCEAMTSIDVDPLNTTYTSVDGVMFSKDLTRLIRFPCGKNGPYTIPTGTLHLEYYSFEYCVNLMSVTIPNTVQTIDEWAFYYSQQLTSIDIPDSVTSIGDSAFQSCSGLTSITIGSGLSNLGSEAFESCNGLLGFTVDPLNANFASVNGVLFSNDLTTLIRYPAGLAGAYFIPAGTTHIGEYAFDDCELLTGVSLPYSLTSIERNAFYDCPELREVTIPPNVTSIKESAFGRCDQLTSVSFLGNAPSEVQGNPFPTYIIEFTFKARVGATGFDSGYFTAINVKAHINITSMAFDPSGNLIITTDALNSNGLQVRHTKDLSNYTTVTGVSDLGNNGFLIPAGNSALTGEQSFFQLEYDSPL